MIENHKLARAISEVTWTQFDSMLQYKTELYGKWFLKIGRFETISKTCNACGHYNKELKLSDRECICPECDSVYDRDVNVALNIRDWAYIAYTKNSIHTGGGEFKSVRSSEDKHGNTRKRVKVLAGQKEASVRTSESPIL